MVSLMSTSKRIFHFNQYSPFSWLGLSYTLNYCTEGPGKWDETVDLGGIYIALRFIEVLVLFFCYACSLSFFDFSPFFP